MASPVDAIVKLPTWQRFVVWAFVAALLGAAFHLVWYADALDARQAAATGLRGAEDELVRMQKKLENFEEERRAAAEAERKIHEYRQSLPMSASSVDNLMQTFQQEARLVGLTVESWAPAAEKKLDYYAKLPVKVKATGNWYQMGEFFRRLSEIRQIVSVDGLKISAAGSEGGVEGQPKLSLEFDAATYRFLSDEERGPVAGGGAAEASRRRAASGDTKGGAP